MSWKDDSDKYVERVKQDDEQCPYCNSDNLEWKDYNLEFVGSIPECVQCLVVCRSCNQIWHEIYTINHIEEVTK